MYRPRASTAVWLQSSRITHRWIAWNLHFHACRVITHPHQTGGVPSCALTRTDVTSVYMAALNATMYSTKKRACTVWRHSHGSTPAPVARPHASILNARQPTRWTVTPRFMLYSCLSRHVCLCFLNNCPLARDLAVHLQNVQTACLYSCLAAILKDHTPLDRMEFTLPCVQGHNSPTSNRWRPIVCVDSHRCNISLHGCTQRDHVFHKKKGVHGVETFAWLYACPRGTAACIHFKREATDPLDCDTSLHVVQLSFSPRLFMFPEQLSPCTRSRSPSTKCTDRVLS